MRRLLRYSLLLPVVFLALTVLAQERGNGRWQLVKTSNKIDGRSECSLVAVNGKLYLIGGDDPAQPVEVYDPKTSTWTKKAMAPVVMHHLQVVGLGDKVYVLDAFYEGGYPDQVPMPNVYSYDTKKDTWEKLAEIPADRRRAGAGEAVHNGKLYLVCGITHGHRSGTSSMFDEYDPATNTWKTLPDAPHIRDHSMAVVVGGRLYAVGGRSTSLHDANNFMSFFDKVVLDVDCYDFKTGTWSTLAAKLPMGTGGGTAVNLDNKIYYIGGERATGTKPNGPQKDVYYLDPSTTNEWTEAADLNVARNGVGGTVLDHKIYIADGAGGGPGGPPPGNMPGLPNPPDGIPPNGGQPNGPPPGQRPGGGDIALEVFILK
jgi:N-acetylneuraminic acid mutarotase